MAYRSEAGKIGNKTNYTDLNMTQYPNNLDTRSNNANMKGFTNIGEESVPDYVMAEYVNTLNDAIMAVERALGTTPMVPTGTPGASISNIINTSSVSSRIGRIESGLFDERYGGAGWVFNPTRPTLSKHNHNGIGGHPSKIILTSEVSGKLPKANLDISSATGLTGGDLLTSKTNAKTIDQSLNDMLSKSAGGTIQGPLAVKGGFRSKTTIEYDATQLVPGATATLRANSAASAQKEMYAGGTGLATLHHEVLGRNLLYGKYVVGIRAKVNTLTSESAFRVVGGGKTVTFKGTDFPAANTYTQLFVVFDHTSTSGALTLSKLATTAAVDVSIDNIFVQPAHPGVFDR